MNNQNPVRKKLIGGDVFSYEIQYFVPKEVLDMSRTALGITTAFFSISIMNVGNRFTRTRLSIEWRVMNSSKDKV